VNRPPDEAIPRIVTLEGMEHLGLEPEEAFVLSRVNGTSTFKEIGQILSYDTARVWKLLHRAVEAGIVAYGAARETPTPVKRAKTPSILTQLDEEERDPALSRIPRSVRNEIRLRHSAMVSQTHYEVLGVPSGSSPEILKRKYVELVKEFHPDRYFGQDLGHYKPKLDSLFERITLAHDELVDPVRRRVYDSSLNAKKPGKKPDEKIRQPPKHHIERLVAAKRYFEMGQNEEKQGNHVKAANFYQLAVQYDPNVREHVKAWERTRHHILRRKADDIYSQAEDSLFRGEEAEGLVLMEEAHRLDPLKKECYRELAMLYLKKGKIREAKEKGLRALEFFPNDPKVHGALGLIYKELGEKKSAIREIRIALKLDENLESLEKVLAELEGNQGRGSSHRD
jgi:tetratricopeptide (TPR) repeat protein